MVLLSDLVLVNAQLTKLVSSTNFLKDVNANGTLTFGDVLVVNNNLAKALPAPRYQRPIPRKLGAFVAASTHD